jgi:hypothetical protein
MQQGTLDEEWKMPEFISQAFRVIDYPSFPLDYSTQNQQEIRKIITVSQSILL